MSDTESQSGTNEQANSIGTVDVSALLQPNEVVREALSVSSGDSVSVQEEAMSIESLARSYEQYIEQFTTQAEQAHKDLLSAFEGELANWTNAVDEAQANLQNQMQAAQDAAETGASTDNTSELNAQEAPHTDLVKAMLDKAGEIKDEVKKATSAKPTTTKTSTKTTGKPTSGDDD